MSHRAKSWLSKKPSKRALAKQKQGPSQKEQSIAKDFAKQGKRVTPKTQKEQETFGKIFQENAPSLSTTPQPAGVSETPLSPPSGANMSTAQGPVFAPPPGVPGQNMSVPGAAPQQRGATNPLQQFAQFTEKARTFLGTEPKPLEEMTSFDVAQQVVPLGVGGKAAKASSKLLTNALFQARQARLDKMAAAMAKKFSLSPGVVVKAAKGLKIAEAARAFNTAQEPLIKRMILKATTGKSGLWVAGAVAGYMFSEQMTFNIKDDQSARLMFEMGKVEKEKDLAGAQRITEMQEELDDAMGFMDKWAGPISFWKQTTLNAKQNTELIAMANERLSQPSPADLEFEERERKREERDAEFARREDARIAAQKERDRVAGLKEVESSKRKEEEAAAFEKRDAERRAERLADEERRDRKREAERRESEAYFETIRLRNEALLQEKRAEAEAYYAKLKKMNEARQTENQRSALTFGLFR